MLAIICRPCCCHGLCTAQGLDQARRIRHAFARNIKRCAMVGRRAYKRQAQRFTFTPAEKFSVLIGIKAWS